jgi:hypothetical protein
MYTGMKWHAVRRGSVLTALALSAVIVSESSAQTRIRGHARYELIKGNPSFGYRELYETNLFFTPANDSARKGRSRRLGTVIDSGSICTNATVGNGEYCIVDMEFAGGTTDGVIPAGTYSILVSEPLFFVAPRVISGIAITSGQDLIVNPELSIDFSTYYLQDWVGSASSPWYQTFEATGTGIRGASMVLAGTQPQDMAFAILHDNGNANPANWTLVGQRTLNNVSGAGGDNWVRWRSGEIPTMPGDKYALRLTGIGGPQGGGFQPMKRNKDGSSYPLSKGRAYNNAGAAQNFDLNVLIFSDNDGTVVSMNKRERGMGVLKDPGYFGTRWGQSFIAQGTSLAAVDVKAAGANNVWDMDYRWRVWPAQDSTGPTGPQVGPTKLTNAAWNAGGFHQGVSYSENEVSLVPGQKYMIDFEAVNPPPESFGFNPYLMDNDSYSGGHGYRWNGSTWSPFTGDDVNMTIVEYKAIAPFLEVTPTSFEREVPVGGIVSGNDVFTVRNVGFDTMVYSVADDADWLSVSPAIGDSAGEFDNITISYSAFVIPTLSMGTHTATVTVTANEAPNSPQEVEVTLIVRPIYADFDGDGDADVTDYAHLQECYSGDGFEQHDLACQDAKLDSDEDVDSADFTRFLACMSGANVPADPGCELP